MMRGLADSGDVCLYGYNRKVVYCQWHSKLSCVSRVALPWDQGLREFVYFLFISSVTTTNTITTTGVDSLAAHHHHQHFSKSAG